MKPYVTVYHKETGAATRIYRATLSEFIATGNYTTDAPGAPKRTPEERKAAMPTAGRQIAREPISEEFKAEHPEEPATPVKPAKEEAPTRKPPRRRAPAAIED